MTHHTHGFYLIQQNRINRDIKDNAVAHRMARATISKSSILLTQLRKYKCNTKLYSNVSRILTTAHMHKHYLDLELDTLHSESYQMAKFMNNNPDMAACAYEKAYCPANFPTKFTISNFVKRIFQRNR